MAHAVYSISYIHGVSEMFRDTWIYQGKICIFEKNVRQNLFFNENNKVWNNQNTISDQNDFLWQLSSTFWLYAIPAVFVNLLIITLMSPLKMA